jgi:hypothetical protein
VLNEELVVDAFEVEGLGIAGDTKGLLAGIDVLEVGGKVEAKMHKVMEGKHVVVRYAEEVAYGEVASDEVVAGSVQAVVDNVLAMHDAVMGDAVMHDEAIGDVQAKVNVVGAESQDNAEDVQVRDAEVVRVGSEAEVQVNETLSIPLAIIIAIIDVDNVEEGVTYQVIKTKCDKIAIRDKSETVVEQ